MQIQPLLLSLMFTFAVTSHAAGQTRVESDEQLIEPKQVSLSVVIVNLRREAQEAMKDQQAWPRDEANFAASRNWSLSTADVLQGLTRRNLDRNAGIDGYIRWQLTSFLQTDLTGVDTRTLNLVSQTSTKPVAQPVIREEWLAASGPGRAFVVIAQQSAYVSNFTPVVAGGAVGLQPVISTAQSGVVLDAQTSTRQYLTVIRSVNNKLEAGRHEADFANQAIFAYRKRLAEIMPDEDGMNIAMQISDLRDRVNAGDPSIPDLAKQLRHAVATSATVYSPRTRKTLAKWLEQTASLQKPVIESIEMNNSNTRVVANGYIARVPLDDAKAIYASLLGTD